MDSELKSSFLTHTNSVSLPVSPRLARHHADVNGTARSVSSSTVLLCIYCHITAVFRTSGHVNIVGSEAGIKDNRYPSQICKSYLINE